jgi:hypothetical protein
MNPLEIRGVSIRYKLTTMKRDQPTSAHLFGVGLDHSDGHKRITRADKFSVVGGSEETHDRITETLVKTFEVLKTKGKQLEQTETKELAEIIHKNIPR